MISDELCEVYNLSEEKLHFVAEIIDKVFGLKLISATMYKSLIPSNDTMTLYSESGKEVKINLSRRYPLTFNIIKLEVENGDEFDNENIVKIGNNIWINLSSSPDILIKKLGYEPKNLVRPSIRRKVVMNSEEYITKLRELNFFNKEYSEGIFKPNKMRNVRELLVILAINISAMTL